MFKILKKTFMNWLRDDPFTQSAATAYYAIFSLPGLLIIIMSLAAIFFEQNAVENAVLGHIGNILGNEAQQNINDIVQETQRNNRDFWAMLVGVVTLAFGATALFAQLQRSLNHIWDVQVKKSAGWFAFVKTRIISFSLILIIGFLLLVSLVLTAIITVFGEWVSAQLSPEWSVGLTVINLLLSLSIISILFALIFKILPDAHVSWKPALMGGFFAAVLFNFGEQALNHYFELAKPGSSFGAAGSIILMMLWVSYSCLILLLGAEFTKTYEEITTGRKAKANGIAKKKLHKGDA